MQIDVFQVDSILAENCMRRQDLADAAGMSKANLSAILNRGSATTKNVGRIAKGLGVAIDKITINERGLNSGSGYSVSGSSRTNSTPGG